MTLIELRKLVEESGTDFWFNDEWKELLSEQWVFVAAFHRYSRSEALEKVELAIRRAAAGAMKDLLR